VAQSHKIDPSDVKFTIELSHLHYSESETVFEVDNVSQKD